MGSRTRRKHTLIGSVNSCPMCGISKDDKIVFNIHHIVPREVFRQKGERKVCLEYGLTGVDDPSNTIVLCSVCHSWLHREHAIQALVNSGTHPLTLKQDYAKSYWNYVASNSRRREFLVA